MIPKHWLTAWAIDSFIIDFVGKQTENVQFFVRKYIRRNDTINTVTNTYRERERVCVSFVHRKLKKKNNKKNEIGGR